NIPRCLFSLLYSLVSSLGVMSTNLKDLLVIFYFLGAQLPPSTVHTHTPENQSWKAIARAEGSSAHQVTNTLRIQKSSCKQQKLARSRTPWQLCWISCWFARRHRLAWLLLHRRAPHRWPGRPGKEREQCRRPFRASAPSCCGRR
uniref:Uncharacterized protein n=1 Tax=Aegilops tauschii subsp. strangulata TaxID=200361 RepID=A0A453QST2_AEGTS